MKKLFFICLSLFLTVGSWAQSQGVDLTKGGGTVGDGNGGPAHAPALLPEISYSHEGGHYIMEASNISEEVNYQWYDEGNNLVGTQKQLSVSANRSGDNYRLRVQSKKDGAVNYANVQLNKMSVIKSVAPSPFVDYFTVSLSNPASAGMHLKVTSVATPQVMDEINILEGETETTLYTSSYPSGVYLVSLYSDNALIETQKIVKQ